MRRFVKQKAITPAELLRMSLADMLYESDSTRRLAKVKIENIFISIKLP